MRPDQELFGLGNAITDALIQLPDDGLLGELDLRRGTMHLVDADRWNGVYARLSDLGPTLAPGGSCANAISTAGLLGSPTRYCGMLGSDVFGLRYRQAMAQRTRLSLIEAVDGRTARCLSLISRDGERTMLTDLGCSMELTPDQLPTDDLCRSRVFLLTGYLLTGPTMRAATFEALDRAREAGVTIAFDVADSFVVCNFHDDVRRIIEEYADIVFLNELEATDYASQGRPTRVAPGAAIETVIDQVQIAVVKLGGRGSLIGHGEERLRIPVVPTTVVDTTGAGDAYAGGFLHAWMRGAPLDRCGALASAVASLTVAQVGAVVTSRDELRACAEAVLG